jgi:dTMP kinase
MERKTNGLFITLEGVEGAGKSTAIQFLKAYFDQLHLPYIITREPGGTEIAEAIRKTVLGHYSEKMAADTELLLMFASRAQHIATKIRPALDSGKIVISDRFTDATYAYQGGGRRMGLDRIAVLESWVQQDLQPDLTFLLDIPVEIGMQRILSRGEIDRIEAEKKSFFNRVRDNYLKRAQQFPDRFKVVQAAKSIEQVQHSLQEIITAFLLAHGYIDKETCP